MEDCSGSRGVWDQRGLVGLWGRGVWWVCRKVVGPAVGAWGVKNSLVGVGELRRAQPWNWGEWLGFPSPATVLQIHTNIC